MGLVSDYETEFVFIAWNSSLFQITPNVEIQSVAIYRSNNL